METAAGNTGIAGGMMGAGMGLGMGFGMGGAMGSMMGGIAQNAMSAAPTPITAPIAKTGNPKVATRLEIAGITVPVITAPMLENTGIKVPVTKVAIVVNIPLKAVKAPLKRVVIPNPPLNMLDNPPKAIVTLAIKLINGVNTANIPIKAAATKSSPGTKLIT